MAHDNRGKVSLWQNPKRKENPKAPSYTGKVIAHRRIEEGEEIELALWPNDSDNPSAPAVTGKIQDKRDD